MPDWFYRTVSRPVLFCLPPRTARDFTLRLLGTLARLPLGPSIIDFLGHMRADSRLRCSYLGIDFPTAVGLGPYLDSEGTALPALARFGVGFLEVGPTTTEPSREIGSIERRPRQEALWFSDPFPGLGLETLMPRIMEASGLGLPVIARVSSRSGDVPHEVTEHCCHIIDCLAPHVSLFSLATLRVALEDGWNHEAWRAHVQGVVQEAATIAPSRPVLLCLPVDTDDAQTSPLLQIARDAGVNGFVVDGGIRDEQGRRCLVGAPAREASLRQVRGLREQWGRDPLIIASGGVHEPEHALELRSDGADLVQIDSGMVYAGPGLPKRINDALLFLADTEHEEEAQEERKHPERATEMTWFWTALMGAGMLWGSLLALVIAATRIVLPYDESFVGMTREQLAAINPRLLPFMAHDRVSLAGTMVTVGALYVGLSLFGIRQGLHWPQKSVFVSAFAGFANFFLFLGFGYLDPFHAFVTACLFQLLLLGVHSRLGTFHPAQQAPPPLRESRAWRWSLWGQLLLILHSVALIGAGLVISVIGVTQVFVPEDLMFMQTTADVLREANPRLVPLVAHDRATLGGMLLSSGLGFLLPALWGYRNGSRWLWWTFLIAGVSAYAAAIGVHLTVRYTDMHHLLPAFAGLALFLTALGLSYSYLCRSDADNDTRWRRFLTKKQREGG